MKIDLQGKVAEAAFEPLYEDRRPELIPAFDGAMIVPRGLGTQWQLDVPDEHVPALRDHLRDVTEVLTDTGPITPLVHAINRTAGALDYRIGALAA